MKIIVGIIILVIVLIIYLWSNYTIELTHYDHTSSKIKKSLRILHISDLHNNQIFIQQLKKIVKDTKPDLVLLTGDFVAGNHYMNSADFFQVLADIPSYYIDGNHELAMDSFKKKLFYDKLMENNIILLDHNKSILFQDHIKILSLDEAIIRYGNISEANIKRKASDFNILLMHQPEVFDKLDIHDIDLIFAGHAHGGQWRIPFINQGILAPNQGLFPKYTSGIYQKDNTRMIVSRGVGTMVVIPRIFNRPQVNVIDINKSRNS